MNDLILVYIVTMVFVCVIVGLLMLYKYLIGDKLTQAANKLKSQIANIRRDYPYLSDKPGKMIGDSIEEIGLDGIIDSLGLPKMVTPFIKGFLSNPDNINKIMEILKSKGISLDANKSKGEEINLL